MSINVNIPGLKIQNHYHYKTFVYGKTKVNVKHHWKGTAKILITFSKCLKKPSIVLYRKRGKNYYLSLKDFQKVFNDGKKINSNLNTLFKRKLNVKKNAPKEKIRDNSINTLFVYISSGADKTPSQISKNTTAQKASYSSSYENDSEFLILNAINEGKLEKIKNLLKQRKKTFSKDFHQLCLINAITAHELEVAEIFLRYINTDDLF